MSRMNRLPKVAITLLALAIALSPGVRAQRAATQTGTVSGVVRDAQGLRPLASAQVYVQGTGIGQITNQEGRYTLRNVRPGQVIVAVQLIGYAEDRATLEVAAGATVTRDFALKSQVLGLDEIIVTGTAGQARRREVGQSVAQINAVKTAAPVVTTDQLLGGGRVAGLTLVQGSGSMGAGAKIRLRGNSSATMSNQPIIYVDGIRINAEGPPTNSSTAFGRCACESNGDTSSPLNSINPADIDRVEVVRGPAATTLYGTEAAAGVIQIFTKRGGTGAPIWTLQTTQAADRVLPFGTEKSPYLGRPELDMGMDRWLRTAWAQNYNLSVRGGTPDVGYFLSGAFDDNEGVLPNDAQKKTHVRGNLSFRPAGFVSFEWNTSLTRDKVENTPSGTNRHGLVANVFRAPVNFMGSGAFEDLNESLRYHIGNTNTHYTTGLTANLLPNSAITNRVTLGYDRLQSQMFQSRPFDFKFEPGGSMIDLNWVYETFTADYVGKAKLNIGRELNSTFAWGGQSVTTEERSMTVQGAQFPGPGLYTVSAAGLQATSAVQKRVINGGFFVENLLGFRERYFLTLGVRVDGNSAFGDDFGLQTYPKVSASYVISDEPFWPAALGDVKLRAAYGQAGRAPGAFDAVRTWQTQQWGTQPTFIPGNVGDSNLGPERAAELELGFDGAFADSRITLDFTYYNKQTSEALFNVRQVPSSGFTGTQLRNVGKISNTGVEFAANAVLLRGSSLVWELGGNLGTNKSEVVSLGGEPEFTLGMYSWIAEGYPLPTTRGTLIRNPDEIAEPIIELNHLFGANHPTLSAGLNTAVDLPGKFRIEARGEYFGGHYVYDHLSGRAGEGARAWAWCKDQGAYEAADRGDMSQFTAKARAMCGPTRRRDMFIFPGDFFSLRWVTLQVPVPSRLLFPGARDASVTLAARNFYTWRNSELTSHPERGGDSGLRDQSWFLGENIPAPARLAASLRVVF